MSKSGITFKGNFNPKNLEKMLLAEARKNIERSADIPLNCPGCEYRFQGHIGLNTCPNCQAEINFSLSQ